ncbi:MAG: DEAD/DEAH box helicase family protein, partial [Lachnospiraceae bacterium]|nr:DEAD/DEAH box helicase family protein [Lachnospiraceae bacterium]
MSWILDYDGVLKLYFPEKDTGQMRSSVFYKLSLKRYVHQLDSGCAIFKSALTYLDFKKTIPLCQKQCADLTVSPKLQEYIDSKEIYVERRFRLGGELKNHDPKLSEQYSQYKSAVDSTMVRPLREQQMWDSFFMCVMQKSCNFSVPGSGKTASVLGMYAYLREKSLVNRILVICPKNAFGSWMDEFSACFGEKLPVRVLSIHDARYKNTNDRRNALQYESGRCNLILVNYESVGSLEEILVELAAEKTLLVFDEVHKVKRVGGEHSSHALKLAKAATHIVALTGTPIPNSYLDVYNLLH